MKEYLKMSDVFKEELYTDDESGSLIIDDHGIVLESFSGDKVADYTLHAISSHDELVENMQHYKQDAEQWEAIATKEASRAQDLEAEVERLRGMVIRMQTYLDMAGEYPEKESDNPVRNWMFDALDCIK